jgi:Flp pilus assembly pilin Flp
MLTNKNAQSVMEYAVIIAVITAGLIAMQLYLKRGLQGALRNQSESIGEQYRPGQTVSVQEKETTVNTTQTSRLGLSRTETEETSKQRLEQKVWR